MTRRLRAAWSALRSGRTYADGYRLGLAHSDEDSEIVDRALLHAAVELVATNTDHAAAQAAAENFPLGRPRPTNQPLRLLHGGAL